MSDLADLTDYAVYKLSLKLKQNPNASKIKFNDTKFNNCKFVSIWSLSYFSGLCQKSLLDLHSPDTNKFLVHDI